MSEAWKRRVKALAFGLLATVVTLFAEDTSPVPYPDGFRSWTHVKSLIVGPDHETFAKRGGIHHYYANGKAVAGYRSGVFPDGSIVVDEAVWTKDGDGRTKGLVFEGERRFLDVMVKDSGSTGAPADGATSISTGTTRPAVFPPASRRPVPPATRSRRRITCSVGCGRETPRRPRGHALLVLDRRGDPRHYPRVPY